MTVPFPHFGFLSLHPANPHTTRKAYKAMGDHYSWWILLPHDDFARIVDPSDQAFTLLAANCTYALNRQPFLDYVSGKSCLYPWRICISRGMAS